MVDRTKPQERALAAVREAEASVDDLHSMTLAKVTPEQASRDIFNLSLSVASLCAAVRALVEVDHG